MIQPTAESFLKDVKTHEMSVKLHYGIYRHLRFSQSHESWLMWFEIVTWPGGLVINGDMGSWSFSRISDMFDFFRRPDLSINPSYWGEKIQSESRFGGPHKKFDADTYKANVLESLDNYGLTDAERKDLIKTLEEEVFNGDEEWEQRLRGAVSDFKHDLGNGERNFVFSDSSEISGDAYTYNFLWCLYAIVWGIQQYDAEMAARPAGSFFGTDLSALREPRTAPTPE